MVERNLNIRGRKKNNNENNIFVRDVGSLLPTGVHEYVLLVSVVNYYGWLAHVLTKWREMVERNLNIRARIKKLQNTKPSKIKDENNIVVRDV